MSEWTDTYRARRMDAGLQVARESVTRAPAVEGERELAKGADKPTEAKGRKLGL